MWDNKKPLVYEGLLGSSRLSFIVAVAVVLP